jgi:hypothetical protein
MSSIKAVNDFVIKFANVNSSGPASANEMFSLYEAANVMLTRYKPPLKLRD